MSTTSKSTVRPGTPSSNGTSVRPGTPNSKGTAVRPGTPGSKGTAVRPGTPGSKGTGARPGTPGSKGTTVRPGTPNGNGTAGRPGTPNSKASPATPRGDRLNRGVSTFDSDSGSSLLTRRASLDQSPRSITSKSTADWSSSKLATMSDKRSSGILKPSELRVELNVAQEDLKKTKEKLLLVEKEKARAYDELKEVRVSLDKANEKLSEALLAQKRAEESSEIEMFRAIEIEQKGIEAIEIKEGEWEKEIEQMRSQHAVDVAALLSATHELQRVKLELVMTFDAKNQAMSHAENATKIAEIHAEKVAALSAELVHLKTLLDSRDEKAKDFEGKLEEKENTLEEVSVELEAAKMAEYYARNLLAELDEKFKELACQAEEAKKLEKTASESLKLVVKELQVSKDSLHEAESEIATLKEKVGFLETSIGTQKGELEESGHNLERAKEETSEMVKKIEVLKSELQTLEEEKNQALNNEKLAVANVQTLVDETSKLLNELETSRDDEEKSKKALETLTSALHEVSSEAREAKEKLISIQAEYENYERQIEDSNLVIKTTNEKYETMLADAKQESDSLTCLLEQSKNDHANSKAEWEQKEHHLINAVKSCEEKNSLMENETSRLLNLLKLAEEEACVIREEGCRWKTSLKEAESELIYLKEVVSKTKAESMRLKEGVEERESELCNVRVDQNLQKREEVNVKKVDELTKLPEEALVEKQEEENGELADSLKEHEKLPKSVQFSAQNGIGDIKHKEPELKVDVEKEKDNEESAGIDVKMLENCKKVDEQEREQDSVEDEVGLKTESGECNDLANVVPSRENVDNSGNLPSKQASQQQKKKKSPLLRKFESLLKKKGSTTNLK